MSFSKPALIRKVIDTIEVNDANRQKQRGWVDSLFNGDPPWTPAEAAADGIEWSYSNKQGSRLIHDSRGRFNNAHLSSSVYFTLKLDGGPKHKRQEWSARRTNDLGRRMKASLDYETTLRETFAPVSLHGIGPVVWANKWNWKPECVGLADLKIPSRTYMNFRNLTEFGIYREFTPGELWKKISGEKVDRGWKVSLVKKIIQELIRQTEDGGFVRDDLDLYRNPEKFTEMMHADAGYWCSDAVPVARCWDFYHQDAKDSKWYRKIILCKGTMLDGEKDDFIYNAKRPYADELSNFFHCQFADYNNVSPFYFHSARGLGHMLYDLLFALNRLDCKQTESAFEQMMILFRALNPVDRDHPDKLLLQNLGVIPEGWEIIPNTSRYSPNQNLVSAAMGNLQNSINQNSSSFTNDAAVDAGRNKDQTLGEWSGKLSIYNQMVSATLELSYRYQAFQYREIFRRFCLKDSPDKDVQKHQAAMIKAGIPKELIYDHERWDIIPERVMGGGNRALAVQEAQAIYAMRQSLSPRGAVTSAWNAVMAITNDPNMADELVDLDAMPAANNVVKGTEALFGTIMQGIMPQDSDVADHISVIETMIGMLGAVVNRYEQTGGIAPADQIVGMQTASKYTWHHIELLEQDPEQKAKVKEYSDALGRLDNQIKAFAQRAMEALKAQAEAGAQDEQGAGVAPEIIKAQTKAQIDKEKAQQKAQHKDLDFAAKQQRDDQKLAAELTATEQRAKTDIAVQEARGIAQIRGEKAKAAVEGAEELA